MRRTSSILRRARNFLGAVIALGCVAPALADHDGAPRWLMPAEHKSEHRHGHDSDGVHERTWDELRPEEREVLHRHAHRWSNYPPEFRRRLLRGARRYMQLSPHEQQQLAERARHFRKMSPQEKRRLCARFYRERGRVPPFCKHFKE